MKRDLTPKVVAGRYGVTVATVINWCNAKVMPAVNVASPMASRRRWRMSEEDIETFESKRGNREAVAQ